jgi:salicylate hydroxylase
MATKARILMVGGGLGGLTAALALIRLGHAVTVFEQASQLGDVGAGLTLSQGSQRVFQMLGIQDEVSALASVTLNFAFVHYKTGEPLHGQPDFTDGNAEVAGIVGRHIHRADLHGILARAVERAAPGSIVLSHRGTAFESTKDGVRARFADGSVAEGELLIGADGVRSAVREALWGGGAPRFTGQAAFRCLIPIETARPFLSAGRAAVYQGPNRVFNRYTIRRGALLNCVAIARTDLWREEGWSTPATPDELVALYEGFHPDVTGLMAKAPPEHLIKWGIFDREPLPQWRQGRISLLGDAAHPMLPFLGLGAAMAIEDAAILGRAVEASGPTEEALRRYEDARRDRTKEIYRLSILQGNLVQARDPDNYVHTAAPAGNRQLYEFDPATVPV